MKQIIAILMGAVAYLHRYTDTMTNSPEKIKVTDLAEPIDKRSKYTKNTPCRLFGLSFPP